MAKRTVSPRECSLASALGVVGEKWAMLAVREVCYGVHRFDGIVHHTGAPRDVLAARLRTLVDAGVLRKVRYSERPPRDEYHLTEAGAELAPALLALMDWGRRWAPGAPEARPPLAHICGAPLQPVVSCDACGDPVEMRTLVLPGSLGSPESSAAAN
ncbi:helix-turn-helix domain-containing protein [Streptomyces sp. NPDC051219]|uniref:winged helix-turn-helix transcriptional regulator n=1 Tax=Streptomyces sp. NPDC051219 TaxID=3155283 RepID=UPI00341D63A8